MIDRILRIYNEAGCAAVERQNFRVAGKLFFTAIREAEKHGVENHPSMALIYTNMAVFYQQQGRLSRAHSCLSRALELALADPALVRLSLTLYLRLAEISRQRGKKAQALALYRRALLLGRKSKDCPADTMEKLFSSLFSALYEMQRVRQAEKVARSAAAFHEGKSGPGYCLVSSWSQLADLCLEMRGNRGMSSACALGAPSDNSGTECG